MLVVDWEKVVAAQRVTTETGVRFRFIDPEFADTPLSPRGANNNGGRYNPRGTNALYTSSDPFVATAESVRPQYTFLWYRLKPRSLPKTLFAIEVSLERVIDLTTPQFGEALESLGLDAKALVSDDWDLKGEDVITLPIASLPLTHQIGVAGMKAGAEAIRVPSAEDRRGYNLVIFTDNIRKPLYLKSIGVVTRGTDVQITRAPVEYP